MSRIDDLAQALRDNGLDAYFAQTAVSMGYLHGLFEDAHERFLTLAVNPSGETVLIAPALTETQARRSGVQEIRTWKDGEDPTLLFQQLAAEWDLRSGILAVDDEMPARMLLEMQQSLPAALFKAGGRVLASLRKRKDNEELALLKQAAKIADDAFEAVLPRLKAGHTELQIDQMLVDEMKARGGEPYFCIVAAGPNAAEPHHLSDSTVVKQGEVLLLDFGCEVQRYKSDITRTVAIGQPEPEAFRVYDLVYKAHMAGRRAARLGATGQDVDRATRAQIEAGGYGDKFFHRTGHGLGMQGHEEPNMVEGNTEPLETGNVFSIEPGIYLAGRFGVRIENIVTVTEGGCESLNAEPGAELVVVG
jgi:Xaa-Pro aminopeptidase